MDFTSKHFEIIDLYNLVPDSEFNVVDDQLYIDMMFLDGLAVEIGNSNADDITTKPSL